jgi:hypothetical protein
MCEGLLLFARAGLDGSGASDGDTPGCLLG